MCEQQKQQLAAAKLMSKAERIGHIVMGKDKQDARILELENEVLHLRELNGLPMQHELSQDTVTSVGQKEYHDWFDIIFSDLETWDLNEKQCVDFKNGIKRQRSASNKKDKEIIEQERR